MISTALEERKEDNKNEVINGCVWDHLILRDRQQRGIVSKTEDKLMKRNTLQDAVYPVQNIFRRDHNWSAIGLFLDHYW